MLQAESINDVRAQPEATRAMMLVALAVLLASSVWFSGTAAVTVLRREWSLTDAESAWLTIAVQLGFITGTFLYSFLNLADRFNARRVFFASAVAAAIFNAAFAWLARGLAAAIPFRFLTGLMLAGVYPVGMKIVASWFRAGLGWRLGVLVGALTLGTASPYLIIGVGARFDWRLLVSIASASAIAGGALIVAAVGDGPYLKGRARFDWRMMFKVFDHAPFRYTAFGYFGHMWELYAFWSLIAFYLSARFQSGQSEWASRLPLLSFAAIGAGAFGCVAGGWISRRAGERAVAIVSLLVSGACSALSGFAFELPPALVLIFILVWGVFVVSDSPQFSALAARSCPPAYTGTALTIQNGVGFAITVVSIQLLPLISGFTGWRYAFVFLAIGPAVGAYFMNKLSAVSH
ncbi:MAG TPA: MFS transporter [Blastocatellia bacterium]|nr:MFS transporter [Blastocatellia bacterium]